MIRQLITDCQKSFDGSTFYNSREYYSQYEDPKDTIKRTLIRERELLYRHLEDPWLREVCWMAGQDIAKIKRICYEILEGKREYRYHNSKRGGSHKG